MRRDYWNLPSGPEREAAKLGYRYIGMKDGLPEVELSGGAHAYLSPSGHAIAFGESVESQRYALVLALADWCKRDRKIRASLHPDHFLVLTQKDCIAYVTEPTADSFRAAVRDLTTQRLAR
jgi:hypothetical protein